MWAAAFRLSGDRKQSGAGIYRLIHRKGRKVRKEGNSDWLLDRNEIFHRFPYVFVKHLLCVPLRLLR
jgi:hypothetical protein